MCYFLGILARRPAFAQNAQPITIRPLRKLIPSASDVCFVIVTNLVTMLLSCFVMS